VTLAAAGGAIAAWYGLDAWRRQLAGRADYDAAVGLLRATYRMRNAIRRVRAPMMFASEEAHALKTQGIAATGDVGKDYLAGIEAAYTERWKAIGEAGADLDVAALEAEVLWGAQGPAATWPLRVCVLDLNWALGYYLAERRQSRADEATRKLSEKAFGIVYYLGDDPELDPFSAKVNGAVTQAETLLRPKIEEYHRNRPWPWRRPPSPLPRPDAPPTA